MVKNWMVNDNLNKIGDINKNNSYIHGIYIENAENLNI